MTTENTPDPSTFKFECWEIDFGDWDDADTRGTTAEIAEGLVASGHLRKSSAGIVTNCYGDPVYSHTYVVAKPGNEAASEAYAAWEEAEDEA